MKNYYDFSNIHEYSNRYLFDKELEIDIGIGALKTIISHQDLITKESINKLKKAVESDIFLQKLESQYKIDYLEQFYERETLIIDEINKFQMYSLCLSTYSFFEGRLKSLCDFIEKSNQFKIKIDDLSCNEDLMKYWNYLIKVFEINSIEVEKYFTPLRQNKIIRNIIAHQDGVTKNEQLNRIPKLKGLIVENIDGVNQIAIKDNDYILFLLDKIESFFIELLKAIDIRYKEIEES